MKKYKLVLWFLIILQFTLSSCYAVSNNVNPKIMYMASFTEKKYEFIPPEKPLKFPVEISSWPGEFHEGPDTIDVFFEFTNSTKKKQRNIKVDVLVEINAGKIINSDGEIDVEKSKKVSKYLKYFSKEMVVKQLAPGGKIKVNLKRIMLRKIMNKYIDKNENIWEIKTTLKMQGKSIKKILPIEFYGV
jgi:hypothetical protein